MRRKAITNPEERSAKPAIKKGDLQENDVFSSPRCAPTHKDTKATVLFEAIEAPAVLSPSTHLRLLRLERHGNRGI